MYRKTINAHAMKSLNKLPNIPDFHLMVGSAEELSPLPILVKDGATIPKEVAGTLATMQNYSSDEIAQAIADNSLEVNDINYNVLSLGMGV